MILINIKGWKKGTGGEDFVRCLILLEFCQWSGFHEDEDIVDLEDLQAPLGFHP